MLLNRPYPCRVAFIRATPCESPEVRWVQTLFSVYWPVTTYYLLRLGLGASPAQHTRHAALHASSALTTDSGSHARLVACCLPMHHDKLMVLVNTR